MCTIEQQREVWRIADEAGFDHLWDFDHFHPIGGAPLDGPIFEGWSLLAAMAAATTRVRLGNMVTGLTYRHPAVLAKMAATVDHLSGGRLEFGIGAAWAEVEHTMLGIEFP
ncbi:MAG TPA: LLM class flavin-dependent oxidoreductase, partial [Candidatus Dormibacteraeota bacterium]|nr:LLM class flavin-dependent oxidoreductase [Candidatus Dormibacteraeota bacterium]